jgi:hypothetical protein
MRKVVVRQCNHSNIGVIHEVVNDAAQAVNGIILGDCCKEPTLSKDELRHEVDAKQDPLS